MIFVERNSKNCMIKPTETFCRQNIQNKYEKMAEFLILQNHKLLIDA